MNAALLLTLTVGAPGLKDKPSPEPSIQGEWKVESRVDGGRPSPDENLWVFSPGGVAGIRTPMGEVASHLTYTLSSDGKVKALDFYEGQGNGKADLRQGIYKLDGDTLTVCFTLGSTPRPTSFDAGNDRYLFVFKRVRPKD